MRQAKVLKATPSLACDQITLPLAKHIASRAFEIRLVQLGVGDPGKDLVGEDLVSQGCYFSLDLTHDVLREEYWGNVSSYYKRVSARLVVLTFEASLERRIVMKLIPQNRGPLKEALICSRRLHGRLLAMHAAVGMLSAGLTLLQFTTGIPDHKFEGERVAISIGRAW